MNSRTRASHLFACLVVTTAVLVGSGTVRALPTSNAPSAGASADKPTVQGAACAITELRMDINFAKEQLLVYTTPGAPPVNLWQQSHRFVFSADGRELNIRVVPLDGTYPTGHVLDPQGQRIPFEWRSGAAVVSLRGAPSTTGDYELLLEPGRPSKTEEAKLSMRPMPKLVLKPTDTCPKK